MISSLWQRYLGGLKQAIRGRSVYGGLRRSRRLSTRIEALETRVLLSANVEAKLLGGSLFLTDLSAGSRSLTISQDTQNPSLFNVTPGAGTTINGSSAPAQFQISQLKHDVNMTFNDGFGSGGSTSLSFNGAGFSVPGNIFLNIWGKGSDTVNISNTNVGWSLFSNTSEGTDQISLSGVTVGALTNISAFSGGDTLNVDDSTFNQSFSANFWTSGNTINVERNTSLAGGTTFNGPANFNYWGVLPRGGGGDINVGLQNPNTQVNFNSFATFLAGNVRTSVTATHFNKCDPMLIYCTRAGVEITTTSLPAWTQNHPGYSQTITTDGGVGPLTFSVSAGTLPAGLTLDPTTGVISGTPVTAGSSTFTIQVVDANGPSDTQQYTVVINAPVVITTTTLADWTKDRAGYSQTIATTGGTGAINFTVSAGTLPAGLNLDAATGVISGTPTTAGVSNFTVQATDTVGASDTQAYTVTINPVVSITTTSLPNWTKDHPGYSQTIVATGGTGTKTFTVSAGVLPAGLTLNGTTGVISGTPTAVGVSNFTIQATDTVGASATQAYTVTINDILVVSPTTLPNWTQNFPGYSQTITSTGGTGTVTLSVSAGTVPPGLTFTPATGVLAGTPTTAGTFSFTVTATDSVSATGSRDYTVVIAAPVQITNTSLSDWTLNFPGYSQTLTTTGGTGAITFAIDTGSLPTGLTLNGTTGVISGTPTATGTFNFTVGATDSIGAKGTKAFSVLINAELFIETATLPAWTQNFPSYDLTIQTSGGTPPVDFSVITGTLPTGLTLDAATGRLHGTPTQTGTFPIRVRATDDVGATAEQLYNLVINPPVSISPTTLPDWTQDFPGYSQTLVAAGGTGAVTFAVTTGVLPNGLNLNSTTGAITGTPTLAGDYTFTVTATDSIGATGTQDYSITIASPVQIITTTLDNWTAGHPGYDQTIQTTGGLTPLTFTVDAGTLPTGLDLDAVTGVISGTPSAAGIFNFTIKATDTVGASDSQAYTVTIAGTLSITTLTLPDWTQGHAYDELVDTAGGTHPLTFTVSTGDLPNGLTLNGGTGAITGVPTTPGTFNFTITVTDTVGASDSQDYTVVINDAIVISPVTLPDWTEDFPGYDETISSTGGTGTVTYAITAGALPTGLLFDGTTGALTGTPSAAGTYDFTITATDSVLATASQAYTVTIAGPVEIFTDTLPDWTLNWPGYDLTLLTLGGTGALTFTVTTGDLPTGLILDPLTGEIAGTPTATGDFVFTITATDTVGASGSRDYDVTINPEVLIETPTLAPWTQDHPGYDQPIQTSGGTGALTFTLYNGTLPAGLSLSADGILTGTPTEVGLFQFTVQATDEVGAYARQLYLLTINPVISLSPATLPDWVLNDPGYNETIVASGGTGTIAFAVSSGTLPDGLTLDPDTGVISGTPTVAGVFDFTVTATDSVGANGSNAYTVTIVAPVVITTTSLTDWTDEWPGYLDTLTATGGVGPLTFSVVPPPILESIGIQALEGLPPGLSLNSATGAITGTPTPPGTYTFTIEAADAFGHSARKDFTIAISDVVLITTASLANGAKDSPYSQTVVATGGTGALDYSLFSGSLPGGLTIESATGVISGTPTTEGSFTFTLQATDSIGAYDRQQFTVVINAAITLSPDTLPDGTLNVPGYSQTITATGGAGPFTFAVSSGDLPTGLLLNPTTGVISGTPTEAGDFSFTVTATDSNSSTGSHDYTITILAPVVITTESLSNWTLEWPDYSDTVTATGGDGGPYTYSVQTPGLTSGPGLQALEGLPPGLSLDETTGEITGTPTQAGTYTFTIVATDSQGHTGSKEFTVVINDIVLITTTSLATWTQDLSGYDQTIVATGGTGSKTFSLHSGTLPPGLTLNPATGKLSGTPTTAGEFNFVIRATDSIGASDAAGFAVTINPVVTFSTTTLPSTFPLIPYSQQITATGGTGTITYSLFSGTIPELLILRANGLLEGHALLPGAYTFTILATDSLGATATQEFTLHVLPGEP